MMEKVSLDDACYSSLVRCLQELADDCPDLPPSTPPLHRLRNLLIVLLASSPPQPTPHPQQLTLTGALTLAGTAQKLLESLENAGTRERLSKEMFKALTETLPALSDRIGAYVRQAKAERVRGLYVIIDTQLIKERDPLEIAKASVRGGARMLQLRDKLRDKGEVLPLAESLQELCRANDVDLIINDHVDIAAAVDSAGLHVGQTDFPVAHARRVLAPQQVVGRSNHDFDELTGSLEAEVDHVAFGAIYPTTTKSLTSRPQGVEMLRRVRERTELPLVAIGGITAENVGPVVEAGADAICVTAAVVAAPEPEAAACKLVEAIQRAGGRV